MTKITRAIATEYEVHAFVTEASTLGLPPGRWPHMLDTDLGNGQRFLFVDFDGEGGAHYRQQCADIVGR